MIVSNMCVPAADNPIYSGLSAAHALPRPVCTLLDRNDYAGAFDRCYHRSQADISFMCVAAIITTDTPHQAPFLSEHAWHAMCAYMHACMR